MLSFSGRCKWIRVPAIVYSAHVATTLLPILSHVLTEDFKNSKLPAPQTMDQRLTLCAIYMPYLIIPILILFTMLWHPAYQDNVQRQKPQKQKQK